MAEAWLTAQEPLVNSSLLGESVDEVEQLIRRHEAFRKAAATWEERFSSLRRLTTVTTSLQPSCVSIRISFVCKFCSFGGFFTGRKVESRAR